MIRLSEKWKVLIADDEFIIREGIRGAVNWEELGLQIVAEAEDGEEALELALSHSIDILLVDLNMPIMNGMTLMKHIREQLPHCRIVVITGHDEFTFAQEAIRLRVDDYILKPANPGQLREVLAKVTRQLTKNTHEKEYIARASKQLTKNYSLLLERFCQEWMEGTLSEREIMEQLQFLNLPTHPPTQMILVHWSEFYENQPILKEEDKELFSFAIKNIMTELLEDKKKVVFHDQAGQIVICLWELVEEEYLFFMEEKVLQFLHSPIQLVSNINTTNLEYIYQTYQACKRKLAVQSGISPIVRRAKQFIQENYCDPELTLEVVANHLQISSVYLSRMVKQELGITFVSLVVDLRMKKAMYLLKSTTLTVSEIAEMVGYDTQHYFSTTFKKMLGVTPNQYRKEQII